MLGSKRNFFQERLVLRKQQPEESLDEYLQALKSMNKDCNFEAQTAIHNRDCAIPDTFIRGLLNDNIRSSIGK